MIVNSCFFCVHAFYLVVVGFLALNVRNIKDVIIYTHVCLTLFCILLLLDRGRYNNRESTVSGVVGAIFSASGRSVPIFSSEHYDESFTIISSPL